MICHFLFSVWGKTGPTKARLSFFQRIKKLTPNRKRKEQKMLKKEQLIIRLVLLVLSAMGVVAGIAMTKQGHEIGYAFSVLCVAGTIGGVMNVVNYVFPAPKKKIPENKKADTE